jgi:hypothetical protein
MEVLSRGSLTSRGRNGVDFAKSKTTASIYSRNDDEMSIRSGTSGSLFGGRMLYEPITHEDSEWNEIIRFNLQLHTEEQKRLAIKNLEQQHLIKDELDRQMHDKYRKNLMERDIDKKYEEI